MTDKNLTDTEIKKALYDYKNSNLIQVGNGKVISISDIIDLINRLQAENERLQNEKDNLIRTYSECQVANLQEFMHRIENKLANNTDISMVGYQSVICNMEETYKELVGE